MTSAEQPFEVFPLGLIPDQINDEPLYEELLSSAKTLGAAVPYPVYNTTLSLLGDLRVFDDRTARESLQALPLALAAADVLLEFYESPQVDKSMVWSAALLHDIGKAALPKSLIDKSNEGLAWNDKDRAIMRRHPVAGYYIASEAGLPSTICRAIAEHHHKQYGSLNYGYDPKLNDLERTTRDCLGVGDFTDAALTRTNNRNAHMSRDERLAEVFTDIQLVFDDYYHGDELAHLVYNKLTNFPLISLAQAS